MIVIEPAHEYALTSGGMIQFVKLDKNGVRTPGTTCEELIEICLHRLETFQSGQFPAIENKIAIDCLSAAHNVLALRTIRRIEAGVEGKHEALPGLEIPE